MLFYIAIIIIAILATILTLKNKNVKKQSNKYKVMLLVAIAAIVLFRVIRYASAMGLNLDEAMGGYNS